MGKGEVIFQRSLTRVATTSKDNEFSVVSYNILCDDVFEKNPKLYSYLAVDVKCRGPFPNDCPRHTQLIKEVRIFGRLHLFMWIESVSNISMFIINHGCIFGKDYRITMS